MRVNLIFVILLKYAVIYSYCQKDEVNTHLLNDESVIFVSALFRHGMRTPNPKYLPVQYQDGSYWPEGWWELTNSGKVSSFELGKWFRRKYSHLMSDKYLFDDIYILSSDKDRNIMSAQSFLAGFYPPFGDQVWNNELKWMPVPVHVLHKMQDNLINGGAECPKLNEHKYEKSIELTQEQIALTKYITENIGFPVADLQALCDFYENTEKLVERNVSLPSWIKNIYPEPMKSTIEMSFKNFNTSETYKRLSVGGPLMKDILKNMVAKSEGNLQPDLKMKLYSGHDTTLTDLMDVLGVWQKVAAVIPHSATLLLELTRFQGHHFVNILYKNTTNYVYPLTMPGCETSCPLDKFVSLLFPYLNLDWTTECFSN